MKKAAASALSILAIVVVLAAFSHRLLPADLDECQRDITHVGHLPELPLFHCIGHSERDPGTGSWDHIHPWMTEEWHRDNADVQNGQRR